MTPTPGEHATRVAFVTLGCPKNEVDSDRMAASLQPSFETVHDTELADVVVVNTCSFISEATEESLAAVLDLAGSWRTERDGRRLVVAGCMPSRYGDELRGELPEVDAFLPVADEHRIAEVLTDLTGARASQGTSTRPTRTASGPSAYLQVSEGCDRRCAFCTIPAIRGPYRSRAAADLVQEASLLVSLGARELVLVGQDVSRWGVDLPGSPSLASLLRSLDTIEGVRWLRLMYVQPDGVTDELLRTMASTPAVCRYLDLPLQHASRDVLRRMGRTGDTDSHLCLLARIRDAMPDVSLRTTLMAGFPGETRADAAELLRFVRDARFDYAGVFEYSPEEGTPAASMPGQVPPRTRRARAQRLRDEADLVGTDLADARIGSVVEVLCEGTDESGAPFGRHRGQAPDVDSVVMLDRAPGPGTIVDVRITDTYGYDLVGECQ